MSCTWGGPCLGPEVGNKHLGWGLETLGWRLDTPGMETGHSRGVGHKQVPVWALPAQLGAVGRSSRFFCVCLGKSGGFGGPHHLNPLLGALLVLILAAGGSSGARLSPVPLATPASVWRCSGGLGWSGRFWKVLDQGIGLCAPVLGSPLCWHVWGQGWAAFLPPAPCLGVPRPLWFPHPPSIACTSTAFIPFSPSGKTTPLICAGAQSWAGEGRNCCQDPGGNAAAGKGGEICRSSRAETGGRKGEGSWGGQGPVSLLLGTGTSPPSVTQGQPSRPGGWERVWDGIGSMESSWQGFPGSGSLPVPQRPCAVTAAVCPRGKPVRREGGSGAPAPPAWGDGRRGRCPRGATVTGGPLPWRAMGSGVFLAHGGAGLGSRERRRPGENPCPGSPRV